MSKERSRGGGKGGKPPAGKQVIANRRAVVERNRRHRMKDLCTTLFSLLPPQRFKTSKDWNSAKEKIHSCWRTLDEEIPSLPNQIGRATSYIDQLRERVEEMRARKEQAATLTSANPENDNTSSHRRMMELQELRLPVLELKEIMGSGLQVNLISKNCVPNHNKYDSTSCLVLAKLISILQEEGAEVVSASFTRSGSKVFYHVHAQVKITRLGIEISMVRARLEELRNLI